MLAMIASGLLFDLSHDCRPEQARPDRMGRPHCGSRR
jgi:hypothetical protein